MLVFLLGCLLDAKPADTADTADTSLPSGEAYGCVESSRAPVTDPAVAADGMAFAPDEAVGALSGAWTGDFTFVSGDVAPASFSVAADGAWEVVYRTLYDGGGYAEGAPVEECGSLYAWTTTASLSDATGALAEAFPATLLVREADTASLVGGVALDGVVGTTRPTAWDPADWARNTLSFSGEAADGTWLVSALWQAASADAKEEAATETGVVEPSGMTEGVGTGVFDRRE